MVNRCEKMLKDTDYQRNANIDNNELPLYTCENIIHQKGKKQGWQGCGRKESLSVLLVAISRTLKMELSYDLAIPFLGI